MYLKSQMNPTNEVVAGHAGIKSHDSVQSAELTLLK